MKFPIVSGANFCGSIHIHLDAVDCWPLVEMQSSASATSADAATHDAKCKHKGRSGAKYTQKLKSHEFDLRLQLCRYMIIGFLLIYVYACIYFTY